MGTGTEIVVMGFTAINMHQFDLGAGWVKPSEKTHGADLSDEYVFESAYIFQLSRNISITPDAQLILNPANNLDVDKDWVLGLRCILTL